MSPVCLGSRGIARPTWCGGRGPASDRRRRLNPSLIAAGLAMASGEWARSLSRSAGVVSSSVPLLNRPELRLRCLTPADLDDVKRLCREWFPIDYPDHWYTEITTQPKFYSVACVYHERIIGLVVAQIKDYFRLPKEDTDLLDRSFRPGTEVVYILSLGVCQDYRQLGIASFMLDNLLGHFSSHDHAHVRGVYLHVLTTNSRAINFYEHRGFQAHRFLPYYYNICGQRKDGFTYVLYINGGHSPWSGLDYLWHCCQMVVFFNPWRLTKNALRKLTWAWYHFTPRLRQIAQNSTAIFAY